jgi:hypothetical protein
LPYIAAMDLFIVPTDWLQTPLSLCHRTFAPQNLVWTNVTAHTTAELVARQITEAFPSDDAPQTTKAIGSNLRCDSHPPIGHPQLEKEMLPGGRRITQRAASSRTIEKCTLTLVALSVMANAYHA